MINVKYVPPHRRVTEEKLKKEEEPNKKEAKKEKEVIASIATKKIAAPVKIKARSTLLALLKYPFYPLFNFDNGMNLISESLTILTSAQLLVVFRVCTYILEVLRFCRFLTNFGA